MQTEKQHAEDLEKMGLNAPDPDSIDEIKKQFELAGISPGKIQSMKFHAQLTRAKLKKMYPFRNEKWMQAKVSKEIIKKYKLKIAK